MNRIPIRQYLANYDNGDYKSPDRQTQCAAGWYDIFCKEETLHRRTVALTRRLKSIVKSPTSGYRNNEGKSEVWGR